MGILKPVSWNCLIRRISVGLLTVSLMAAFVCRAETFTVSSPERVEDAALWDREFSRWNFGSGPLLEAGRVPGLYEVHSSVSLIRFDLSGLECGKVKTAVLRLYKPNSFVQRCPVDVRVFEVAPANARWKEGCLEAAEDPQGVSWDALGGERSWAGGPGLAVEKTDYLPALLDRQIAPHDRGDWLEFTLPAELVQNWLDRPRENAGLLIKTRGDARFGEHAYFYSSEHPSGKGPQLVITAPPGSARSQWTPRPSNPRHFFPQTDDPQFRRWLREADNRYTQWTRRFQMTPEQALHIYWFDVIIRGDFLMPRVRVPMFQVIHETEQLIAAGKEEPVREKLREIRRLLLVWEYIRQTQWYDSGPLAEALSPLQLAWLYAKPGIGIFDRIDDKGKSFQILTEAELDKIISRRVQTIKNYMGFTDGQYAVIADPYEKYIRLEYHYRAELRKDLDRLHELIARRQDDVATLEAVKKLHMDHDWFLYYQSLFNTPRWSLLMEHGEAIPLAKTYIQVRKRQHTPRRTKKQIDHAAEFSSRSWPDRAIGKISIVHGPDASSAEQAAFNEFERRLRKAYPQTAYSIGTGLPDGGPAVLAGTLESLPVLECCVEPESLKRGESFQIRSLPGFRNPHLVVAARDVQGLKKGIGKLLENFRCSPASAEGKLMLRQLNVQ